MATPPDDGSTRLATPEEVEAQIRLLTDADYQRLRKEAGLQILGTGFCAEDLVATVVQEPWMAAMGEGGRRWPPDISFLAYLIMTMRRMCQDERRRLWRQAWWWAVLDDVDEQAPDVADVVQRHEQAKKDLKAVLTHFELDRSVWWIIKASCEGLSPAEVQQQSGMTETEYNSTRRRFRRGMQRLISDSVKETQHRKEGTQKPSSHNIVKLIPPRSE